MQEDASYVIVEKAVRGVALKNTHDQSIRESESRETLANNIEKSGSAIVKKLSDIAKSRSSDGEGYVKRRT